MIASPETDIDKARLAEIVRQQGGVIGALRAGVTSEQISDEVLRHWWDTMERRFADFEGRLLFLERNILGYDYKAP